LGVSPFLVYASGMNDAYLAEEIIQRLNRLIQDPNVRDDIGKLLEVRVNASPETCNHPTIQVQSDLLGTLGLLNGIVGSINSGSKQGWGYIAAVFDDNGVLKIFTRIGA